MNTKNLKKRKKTTLNNVVKHSFYVAANNAGLLKNGRPTRSSQNFGDLKKETSKGECRSWNSRKKFD